MTIESWPVVVAVLIGAPVGWLVIGIGAAMWLRELGRDAREAIGGRR